MKIFKNIREFFWPLLEKMDIPNPIKIEPSQIEVNEKHLEKTLEYAIDYHKSESERKKIVEGKSSLFISIISVITSIILVVTSVLVKVNDFSIIMFILVFLLFILSIYMGRTVWYALKTLERKTYFSISINDFLTTEQGNTYYKKLISSITNKVRKNSIVINEKVDNMTMAQEYFKRAIVIVSLYSFIVLLFFISKSGVDFSLLLSNGIETLNQIHLSSWNIIILYFLIIISILLSIKANLKK